MFKQCIICKKWFNPFRYHKNATCSIECRREQTRRRANIYYSKNRDEVIIKTKERAENNKEEKREYDRKRYIENQEHFKEYQKDYRENNPDKLKERKSKYYQKNKIEIHKKVRIRKKERYLKDPDYKDKVIKDRNLRRRLRKNLIPLILKQDNQCPLKIKCSGVLPDDPKLCHVDHIIPRSKGGSDEISNLQVACAKCNIFKGSSILEQIPQKNLGKSLNRQTHNAP